MEVLISARHTLTGTGTGAVGFINESQENRVLAKFVVENNKKLVVIFILYTYPFFYAFYIIFNRF